MKRSLSTKQEFVQIRINKAIKFEKENRLSPKRAAKVKTQLDKDYIEYGAQTCESLCSAILIYLPRELRDMIWKHLSQPYIHKHVWNARYLGDDCMREAVESYYRNKTFKIGAQFYYENFWDRDSPYVYRNNFRTFHSPLSAAQLRTIVTTVEFTINTFDACRKCLDYGPNWPLQRAAEQVQELFAFAPRTLVTIHFKNIVDEVFDALAWFRGENVKIDIHNCEDSHLRTFLGKLDKGLFPAFRKLRAEGYRATFVLESVIKIPASVEVLVDAWFDEVKKYHENLPNPIRTCGMADRGYC